MPIIQQLICKIYAEYEFSAISMVAIEWESIKDINAWRTDIGFVNFRVFIFPID